MAKTQVTTTPLPTETQRARRGHRFYPTKATLRATPALYATGQTPTPDKTITAHYFAGGADWYIAEIDPTTLEAFDYANIGVGGGEWGYVDLPALEALRVGWLVVERDLHWTPTYARDIPGIR